MESSTHDILAGKWHEMKGKIKGQWGKLTDDDITRMSGRAEELAGALQQRYGYDKARAESEIAKWMEDHDDSCKP
jgi:uncharacterized protein YjbJ (UPF0337 family)